MKSGSVCLNKFSAILSGITAGNPPDKLPLHLIEMQSGGHLGEAKAIHSDVRMDCQSLHDVDLPARPGTK